MIQSYVAPQFGNRRAVARGASLFIARASYERERRAIGIIARDALSCPPTCDLEIMDSAQLLVHARSFDQPRRRTQRVDDCEVHGRDIEAVLALEHEPVRVQLEAVYLGSALYTLLGLIAVQISC